MISFFSSYTPSVEFYSHQKMQEFVAKVRLETEISVRDLNGLDSIPVCVSSKSTNLTADESWISYPM